MRIVFFSFIMLTLAVKAHAESSQKWDGLYGGVAIGAAYSQATPNTETLLSTYFITNAGGSDKEQLDPILQRELNGWDITGSALVGYDHQVGNITYGIEADFTVMDFRETVGEGPTIYDTNVLGNFTTQTTIETNFIFSLRPKIGYVVDNFLLHASLGPSVGKFKTSFQYDDTISGAGQLNFVDEKIAFGASSSIGASYQMGNDWLLRGDYVFTYFPDIFDGQGLFNNDGIADFDFDSSFKSHNIRIGLIKYF